MHAVFYMYGMKKYVDEAVKWLETRILPMNFKEVKTGKTFQQGVECQLRPGLLGTWEFIFPENWKDQVLTALKFNMGNKPGMKLGIPIRQAAMRKALKLEPIPEFSTNERMLLPNNVFDFIYILPIGVRYDPIRPVHDGKKELEAI